MTISEETRAVLDGNRVLVPKDDYNRGFNAGIAEAIKFLNIYLNGKGLFQS